MSAEHEKSPQINALEAALAALSPALSRIDRDELMYRAGIASIQAGSFASGPTRSHRGAWLWPLVTAASTLTAATFGVLYGERVAPRIAHRPEPQVIERIVEVPVYVGTPAAETPDGSPHTMPSFPAPSAHLGGTADGPTGSNTGSYFQWRDTALARGVDSLVYLQGVRPTATAPAASYSDLRRDMLPKQQPPLPEPDRINAHPPRTQDART